MVKETKVLNLLFVLLRARTKVVRFRMGGENLEHRKQCEYICKLLHMLHSYCNNLFDSSDSAALGIPLKPSYFFTFHNYQKIFNKILLQDDQTRKRSLLNSEERRKSAR